MTNSPFKGITFDEYFGVEKSREIRRQHAISIMGSNNVMKRPEVREKVTGKNNPLNTNPVARRNQLESMKKPEYIENQRKLHLGEKSYFWQGGISYEVYPKDWEENLRIYIRYRDNYTCQVCYKPGKEVHHIDYDKYNCDETNLITLCVKCHPRTNSNREYWKNYFTSIIMQKYYNITQQTLYIPNKYYNMKMVQVLIYLPPEIDSKLKILSRKWNMSKSDTIQKIIAMFFQEGGDQMEEITNETTNTK